MSPQKPDHRVFVIHKEGDHKLISALRQKAHGNIRFEGTSVSPLMLKGGEYADQILEPNVFIIGTSTDADAVTPLTAQFELAARIRHTRESMGKKSPGIIILHDADIDRPAIEMKGYTMLKHKSEWGGVEQAIKDAHKQAHHLGRY